MTPPLPRVGGLRSRYRGWPAQASEIVPPGGVWIVEESDGELKQSASGYEYRTVSRHVAYNPRDQAGYPSRLERELHPTPGYTDRTLGAHEAARDWRRRRRHRRHQLRRLVEVERAYITTSAETR